jgi:hypothetical protein
MVYTDATSFPAQRRDALVHAIRLSHSPHASLKRLAAVNIAKFFKAFPDIEEDAINAIYDLCEDQDQNVSRHAPRSILSNKLTLRLLFFVVDPDSRIRDYRSDVQGTASVGGEERGRPGAVASER